jgi:hypothetical protein
MQGMYIVKLLRNRIKMYAAMLLALRALAGRQEKELTVGSLFPPVSVLPILPISPAEPLFNIDSLGGTENPLTALSPIKLKGLFDINGWVVDRATENIAKAVYVQINDKKFPAVYGVNRTDVASHFRIANYANSGFSASIPSESFARGLLELSLLIISADGTRYYKTRPISVKRE